MVCNFMELLENSALYIMYTLAPVPVGIKLLKSKWHGFNVILINIKLIKNLFNVKTVIDL